MAYTLDMIITDYAGDVDVFGVVLFTWIMDNQSELMANLDKVKEAITFEAVLINLPSFAKMSKRSGSWGKSGIAFSKYSRKAWGFFMLQFSPHKKLGYQAKFQKEWDHLEPIYGG
ncbi:phage tail protein, partial [Bacillus sp. B-TM1]